MDNPATPSAAQTAIPLAGSRPNVVLINCDDLGYGDLGCYGSAVNPTPGLDALAAEGIRFTDFYAASPLCSPSRAALMTGCYPPRIGFGSFEGGHGVLFPGHRVGLNPSEVALPRLLRDLGYATMMVGKWHCGDQPEFLPTSHGFEHYFGLPYSNDMGRQRGKEDFPPLPLLRDLDVVQEQPDQAGLTERYTQECVQFIREHRHGAPFFLYLAHMYVHRPIYAPHDFVAGSRNGRYGAAVAMIDWSTRAILDELDRWGLARDTLVVFTSDNGSRVGGEGGSNGRLRGVKGETWEGGMRVPGIMRWPAAISPGQVCPELVTSMDLLPTLAVLAGGRPPADRILDGHDLSPLLSGALSTPCPDRAFFYYYRDDLEAVRVGRWRLHVRKHGRAMHALYDVVEDAGETVDVLEDHPDVASQMHARLAAARHDLGDAATGVSGHHCRPIGQVPIGRTLTEFRPDHPYLIAMYDLDEAG